ncbi:hypothetical protein [Halosimplex carlsbadense]|nr:hypothetical protein [Halosimplex carlsbadense]
MQTDSTSGIGAFRVPAATLLLDDGLTVSFSHADCRVVVDGGGHIGAAD